MESTFIAEHPINFADAKVSITIHKTDRTKRDDNLTIYLVIKEEKIVVRYDKIIGDTTHHTSYDLLFFATTPKKTGILPQYTDFENYLRRFANNLVLDENQYYSYCKVDIDNFPSYSFDASDASKYVDELLGTISFMLKTTEDYIELITTQYKYYSTSEDFNTYEKCQKYLVGCVGSEKHIMQKWIEKTYKLH